MKEICNNIHRVKEIQNKISKCDDPYQRIGYKVQTILYAYGCDSCECLDRKYGNFEYDGFYIKEDNVYKLRINGLDLVLKQWIEDNKCENFATISLADTNDIVCDRVQHIMVDGDWEDVVEKLYKSSIALIVAIDDYDWDFNDGISFNANNKLTDIIIEMFNNLNECKIAEKLCKSLTGEAIALDDRLIITKDIITDNKDLKTTNYRIFDMSLKCEEVYNTNHTIGYTKRGELYTTGWLNSFRPGNWQDYILNYYDNMPKKEKQKINTISGK